MFEGQDHAACRGKAGRKLEPFFGPDGERGAESARRVERAREICEGCPVRVECLELALSVPILYGVWGGKSEDERKSERKRRQRRAQRQPVAS